MCSKTKSMRDDTNIRRKSKVCTNSITDTLVSQTRSMLILALYEKDTDTLVAAFPRGHTYSIALIFRGAMWFQQRVNSVGEPHATLCDLYLDWRSAVNLFIYMM